MSLERRLQLMRIAAICAGFANLVLAGCVQTHWQTSAAGNVPVLSTANQMMDLEESDRVRRFERLAQLHGVHQPQIEQMVVPADQVSGATRPVPVIRVVFAESALFASGSATPEPGADAVLDVIADNMRHDVPDVRLTVLGHTDATGTDAQNDELSRRRAVGVLQRLVDDGVNPAQLGTVAIGKAQPIAPNDTAAGRAQNRRVEFLISPNEQANLRVVETRRINPAFLALGNAAPARPARSVQFLKPEYTGPSDISEAPLAERPIALRQVQPVSLNAGSGDADTGSPVARASASVAFAPAAPTHTVQPLQDSGSPVTAVP